MEDNNNVESNETKQEPVNEAENNPIKTDASSETGGTTFGDVGAKAADTGKKVLGFIKAKKFPILIVIAIIVVVAILANVLIGSPAKAVKQFYSALNSQKSSKVLKTIDWAGIYVLATLDEDDYDDFWEEYEDFIDSDDYDDLMDEISDSLDDDSEDIDDALEDADIKYSVKKIKKTEKVGKNLWKVKAQVIANDDGDKDTSTVTFYVMKKSGNYYIIGGGYVSSLKYLVSGYYDFYYYY